MTAWLRSRWVALSVSFLRHRRIWLWLGAPLLALVVVFSALNVAVIRLQPVDDPAMAPSLLPGDVVLINRLAYIHGPEALRRGDVIAYRNDQGDPRFARIIGLPGEAVALQDGKLVINDVMAQTTDMGGYEWNAGDGRIAFITKREESLLGARITVLTHAQAADAQTAAVSGPPDNVVVLSDFRLTPVPTIVPRSDIIGRAERVTVSTTSTFVWLNPASWGRTRPERVFMAVEQGR